MTTAPTLAVVPLEDLRAETLVRPVTLAVEPGRKTGGRA